MEEISESFSLWKYFGIKNPQRPDLMETRKIKLMNLKHNVTKNFKSFRAIYHSTNDTKSRSELRRPSFVSSSTQFLTTRFWPKMDRCLSLTKYLSQAGYNEDLVTWNLSLRQWKTTNQYIGKHPTAKQIRKSFCCQE